MKSLYSIALAVALLTFLVCGVAQGGVTEGARGVFVRFQPKTIHDPGPANLDRYWNLDEFSLDYEFLMQDLSKIGVLALRPVGLSWRNRDLPEDSPFVDFSFTYLARLVLDTDPVDAIQQLNRLPSVEYAEVPDFGEYYSDSWSSTSARYTSTQWWMENTGQTTANCPIGGVLQCVPNVDANIPQGWLYADASNALVAIFDSGVYTDGIVGVPENGYLAASYNGALSRVYYGGVMNDDGIYHGTRVAGIVAGHSVSPGSFEGIVGNTPPSGDRPLVVFKVGNFGGWSQVAVTDGLDFICNPDSSAFGKVRIATFSIGKTTITNTLSAAFKNAYLSDIAIIAAAGVGGGDCSSDLSRPFPAACIDFSQAVAHIMCDATRGTDLTGTYIDITAPGGAHIETTDAPGSAITNCFTGTSAAAPIVAGVASLVRGLMPGLTNDDVYSVIEQTASDVGPIGYDVLFGNGLVRADSVLNLLDSATGGVQVKTIPAWSSVSQVDSLDMVFESIPLLAPGPYYWAKVFLVEAYTSLPPSTGSKILTYWIRDRDAGTVRGPSDLIGLDCHVMAPFFNGLRLHRWAEVEQVGPSIYRVSGYVYHIYQDSSQSVDLGWYPFNPSVNPPSPLFTVAYLEGPARREDGAPMVTTDVDGGVLSPAGSLRVEYTLPRSGEVRLSVYDISGRFVVAFDPVSQNSGDNYWEIGPGITSGGVSSGVYFIRLSSPGWTATRKIVVLR
jgi:hypothetical protein